MGHEQRARLRAGWPLAVVAAGLLAVYPPVSADSPFLVETLADGVHLFRPADAASRRANSLVVERSDGLLVVDAQPTPESARELLTAMGDRVPGTPRYLVLSHPHAEAAGGATAFPQTTLLLGTSGCQEALGDEAYDFGAEVRARAGDPAAWTEPARRPPTAVFSGKVVLDDPRNPVELLPLGRAHSRGDVLVHLPGPNLVHVGAILVTDGDPYPGDANLQGWISSLNHLARWGPQTFIPVRGPAVPVDAVRKQRDALAWLVGQVQTRFPDRPSLEGLRREVLELPGTRERFATGNPASFVPLLVDRAIEEAVQHRRKRGLM